MTVPTAGLWMRTQVHRPRLHNGNRPLQNTSLLFPSFPTVCSFGLQTLQCFTVCITSAFAMKFYYNQSRMSPAICFSRIWSVIYSEIKHMEFLWRLYHQFNFIHSKFVSELPLWVGRCSWCMKGMSSTLKQPQAVRADTCRVPGAGSSDFRAFPHLLLTTTLGHAVMYNERTIS